MIKLKTKLLAYPITVPITKYPFVTIEEANSYYATFLKISQDEQTGVITLSLLSKDNTILDTQTLDLPTEKVLTGVSFDESNYTLTFTLLDGSTITCDISSIKNSIENNFNTLNDTIKEETTNRINADSQLQNDLTSLINEKVSDLTTQLNEEVERATTKETAIETNLNSFIDSTNTNIDTINTTLKSQNTRISTLESANYVYDGDKESFISDFYLGNLSNGNYISNNNYISVLTRNTENTDEFLKFNYYLEAGEHNIIYEDNTILATFSVEESGYYNIYFRPDGSQEWGGNKYYIQQVPQSNKLTRSVLSSTYFVRGTFNNWGNPDTMPMYETDTEAIYWGTYFTAGTEFKICDSETNSWYPENNWVVNNSRFIDITFNKNSKSITVSNSALAPYYIDKVSQGFRAIIHLSTAIIYDITGITKYTTDNGGNRIVQQLQDIAFTSSYDDLINKPSIYTKTEVDTQIDNLKETKVDKVQGKGLSTNDLTNELKSNYDKAFNEAHTHNNKPVLDNLVQSVIDYSHTHLNKSILDGTTASFTEEQATKLSNISNNASNVAKSEINGNILIDSVETQVYNDSAIWTNFDDYYTQTQVDSLLDTKANIIHTHTVSQITDFPSNVSYFSNDAGYLTATNIEGKLDTDTFTTYINDTAPTTYVAIADFKTNYLDANNVAYKTDLSSFITNDVDSLVNYYTKSVIDSKLSNLTNFHFEKVDELPQTGGENVIYLVPNSSSTTGNVYDEYYWDSVSNSFETLGSTAIDLSNYYTKTEVDNNYYTKSNIDSKLEDYASLNDSNSFTQIQSFDGSLGINIGTVHLTQTNLQALETQAEKIPSIESKFDTSGAALKAVSDKNGNDITTTYALKSEIPSTYQLPIASTEILGGIKVGSGLSINSETGVLSATGGGVADSVDWANVVSKPFNSLSAEDFTVTTNTLNIATTKWATIAWVQSQNYLTEHQSLNNYYTKEETNSLLNGKLNTSDYTPITVTSTSVSDGTNTFNQYVLPSDVVIDENYVHTDNNFTTTLLNKLNGIENNAQVNVQSNWNETSEDSDAFILNKPTLGILASKDSLVATDIPNLDASKIVSGTFSDDRISSASTWNNKQDKLSTQTQYTAVGNTTKTLKITTNNLGQVTNIEEVDIPLPQIIDLR